MVLIVKTNSHVTQGCFVPSLAEMGPVVLEIKNFKFRNNPHWKRVWPNIFKNILESQGCFVTSLIEVGPVVLKERRGGF